MPKNKKAKQSNLSAATMIKPFAVCTDVILGPLLTGQSREKILKTWTEIEKNIDSSDQSRWNVMSIRASILVPREEAALKSRSIK
jgi:hypothetical protein